MATPKADVWSIGVILYILIVGDIQNVIDPGTDQRNNQALQEYYESKFDFKEP